MPLSGLTAEQFDRYRHRGELHTDIIVPVLATQQNAKKYGVEPQLSGAAREVYYGVLHDLEEVDLLLRGIVGTDIENCPLEQPQQGGRNYTLTRMVLFDHNVLEIRKTDRPDFYWRVAIRDNSEADPEITGFYHGCSSGNLNDIRDAIFHTQHLFPRVGSKLRTGAISTARLTMT